MANGDPLNNHWQQAGLVKDGGWMEAKTLMPKSE
jgi:hypothetical protein